VSNFREKSLATDAAALRVRLAKISLVTAGLLLLLETLLGIVYVLGIGFDTLPDILLDLCLTMAFPIFLVGFASLRYAAIALWIFFFVQWMNTGFFSSPSRFHLTNPFDWFHGIALCVGAVLVSFAAWSFRKTSVGGVPATLRTVF
jgi:hypothetical protein